ncbi:hypothetical protein ACIRBX_11775 [Kitasatospora sp. NPDC096147]|uniref:hypothetical protein n=1 Tax=Kitasatospora sp. NPDC096147 TaxID=3364093 RepID=UPI00380F1D4F
MKLPRVLCPEPSCARQVALMPLATRAGYGVVHDHKLHSRSLALCPGSMTHVPLSEATARQDQLPLDGLPPAPSADQEPLFD